MVGLGVLSRHAKNLSRENRDHLRAGISKDLMFGLERFMEGGYYANLRNLLALGREATWLEEQQKVEVAIHSLKHKLHRGNCRDTVIKAKQYLVICKSNGCRREKNLAAQLFAAVNSLAND